MITNSHSPRIDLSTLASGHTYALTCSTLTSRDILTTPLSAPVHVKSPLLHSLTSCAHLTCLHSITPYIHSLVSNSTHTPSLTLFTRFRISAFGFYGLCCPNLLFSFVNMLACFVLLLGLLYELICRVKLIFAYGDLNMAGACEMRDRIFATAFTS